jgi:hypothetical protein
VKLSPFIINILIAVGIVALLITVFGITFCVCALRKPSGPNLWHDKIELSQSQEHLSPQLYQLNEMNNVQHPPLSNYGNFPSLGRNPVIVTNSVPVTPSPNPASGLPHYSVPSGNMSAYARGQSEMMTASLQQGNGQNDGVNTQHSFQTSQRHDYYGNGPVVQQMYAANQPNAQEYLPHGRQGENQLQLRYVANQASPQQHDKDQGTIYSMYDN